MWTLNLVLVPLFSALLSRLDLVTAFQLEQLSSNRSQLALHGEKTNKAMDFLMRMGKVGGNANKDYRFALGVDEGPSGKAMSSRRPHVSTLYNSYSDDDTVIRMMYV
jgi:hypothetical protein